MTDPRVYEAGLTPGQMDVFDCIEQAALDAQRDVLLTDGPDEWTPEDEAEYLATSAGTQDYLNDEVWGRDAE